ncbi:MAG TPA: guanylate kinase [Chloroflexota bacterium]|nr:guanylate kinase [Chloroflexota bacterium]
MSEEQGGLLFVLSGPSGVGKDAAIARMKELNFDICYTITATTRQPRANEVNGVHYFFYSPETFTEMVERGEFLESAVVHGRLYGSPRQQVREQLARGNDVLLKIDVQGARQVKAKVPDAVFIFLAPPSIADLVGRLKLRNTESEEERARRIQNAYVEMEAMESYDYKVVNHDGQLDDAVRQIGSIIEAERCRVQRRQVIV